MPYVTSPPHYLRFVTFGCWLYLRCLVPVAVVTFTLLFPVIGYSLLLLYLLLLFPTIEVFIYSCNYCYIDYSLLLLRLFVPGWADESMEMDRRAYLSASLLLSPLCIHGTLRVGTRTSTRTAGRTHVPHAIGPSTHVRMVCIVVSHTYLPFWFHLFSRLVYTFSCIFTHTPRAPLRKMGLGRLV